MAIPSRLLSARHSPRQRRGVYLGRDGAVNNASTGTISGNTNGVEISGATGAVISAGAPEAPSDSDVLSWLLRFHRRDMHYYSSQRTS